MERSVAGRVRSRTEAGDARSYEGVGDSGDEWGFWADDNEFYAVGFREREDFVGLRRGEREGVAQGFEAGVSSSHTTTSIRKQPNAFTRA